MTERPIIVTAHAIEAYSRRTRDERHWRVLEEEIRECVARGIEAGLIFNHRPPGFVLYRRKNTNLPPGQRFVQCDTDSNYGFILKRDPEEGDVVVTTLTRVGVR
jgi:hypothetical protein